MSNFQRVLLEKARVTAIKSWCGKDSVDVLGYSNEDYQSIFALQLLESTLDSEAVLSDIGLECWATVVMRNKRIRMGEMRTREKQLQRSLSEVSDVFYGQGLDSEERLVNKDLVSKLREYLTVKEWSILSAYVGNDCCVRDTWRELGGGHSYSMLWTELEKVKKKCRKYLSANGCERV